MATTDTILVLDFDGVICLSHPGGPKPWSTDLARDWKLDPAVLNADFFGGPFVDVVRGRLDLHAALDPWLAGQGIVGRTLEFVSWWFERDSVFDTALLDAVRAWRARTGGRCYVATNQEHHRIGYLRGLPALADVFDEFVYSAALGVAKPERVFFTNAQQRIGVSTGRRIAFFDDAAANVDAARACGWRAWLYRDRGQLEAFLDADG